MNREFIVDPALLPAHVAKARKRLLMFWLVYALATAAACLVLYWLKETIYHPVIILLVAGFLIMTVILLAAKPGKNLHASKYIIQDNTIRLYRNGQFESEIMMRDIGQFRRDKMGIRIYKKTAGEPDKIHMHIPYIIRDFDVFETELKNHHTKKNIFDA